MNNQPKPPHGFPPRQEYTKVNPDKMSKKDSLVMGLIMLFMAAVFGTFM